MSKPSTDEAQFWSFAEPLLAARLVTRSTMMGFPCLHVNGRVFASFDHRTGALVVKLPASRVDELISSGHAEPFAPAGRKFREWASIDPAKRTRRSAILDEALSFVAAG